jgi:hypothetical protein
MRACAPSNPEIFQQVDAIHQVHSEEPARALRKQLVQTDQVGMHDVRERAKFRLEQQDISAGHAL